VERDFEKQIEPDDDTVAVHFPRYTNILPEERDAVNE